MAKTFLQIESEDVANSYNQPGVAKPAVYYFCSGGQTNTTVQIDRGDQLVGGMIGANAGASATVRVQVTHVPKPEEQDAIVVETETWRVIDILSGDDYEWVLRCVSSERMRP